MKSDGVSDNFRPEIGLESRKIRLRPYSEDDRERLYGWHTELDHSHLWTQDREILPFDRFTARFERRMKNRIDLFFMIEQLSHQKPVGFVYNYGSDSVDRVTYLTLFIDQRYKVRGYGVDASFLFLNYLFADLAFRKVYSEVYGFNFHVTRLMEKAGLDMEGRLKEHRWWRGRFWDQYIYSVTDKSFQPLLDKYLPYLISR